MKRETKQKLFIGYLLIFNTLCGYGIGVNTARYGWGWRGMLTVWWLVP